MSTTPPTGWANLKSDLSQLEGILAAVGTIQGVVIAALPVGQWQHIASGIFGAASVLGICIQKLTSA